MNAMSFDNGMHMKIPQTYFKIYAYNDTMLVLNEIKQQDKIKCKVT